MNLFDKFCRFAVRGPFHMALAWAIGWAFLGGFIEALVDPHGEILDMWIQTLALPGFFGGAVFFTVLRYAKRRDLAALPLPLLAAFGVASGLLTGVLLFAVVSLIATTTDPWMQAALELLAFTTVQGIVAGAGSALLFRCAARTPSNA